MRSLPPLLAAVLTGVAGVASAQTIILLGRDPPQPQTAQPSDGQMGQSRFKTARSARSAMDQVLIVDMAHLARPKANSGLLEIDIESGQRPARAVKTVEIVELK